jgi:hypothetical protein
MFGLPGICAWQWKIASWISLFACLSSMARMKTSEIEFKQVFGPFMYCAADVCLPHGAVCCAAVRVGHFVVAVYWSQVRADGHHHELLEPWIVGHFNKQTNAVVDIIGIRVSHSSGTPSRVRDARNTRLTFICSARRVTRLGVMPWLFRLATCGSRCVSTTASRSVYGAKGMTGARMAPVAAAVVAAGGGCGCSCSAVLTTIPSGNAGTCRRPGDAVFTAAHAQAHTNTTT